MKQVKVREMIAAVVVDVVGVDVPFSTSFAVDATKDSDRLNCCQLHRSKARDERPALRDANSEDKKNVDEIENRRDVGFVYRGQIHQNFPSRRQNQAERNFCF